MGAEQVATRSNGGAQARQAQSLGASEPNRSDVAITPVESTPAPPRQIHDITTIPADADVIEGGATAADQSFEPDVDVDPVRDVTPTTDQPELDRPVAAAERDDEEVGLAFSGGFRTELGGFAYLINLMCRLDLPDCFEDDWRLATAVGPWGTLELLGRALACSSAANDALWPALAQLASRPEGTLPGLELVRPEECCLPETWSVPDAVSETWQPSSLTAGLSEAAVDWLRLVGPVVQHVLRLRLGGDDPAAELLRQPGQVYISSTHVDVVLPLDAISIPIRIAGLDRDPGWLPDFGRVVKIHFT
jgi:hypothetical protein